MRLTLPLIAALSMALPAHAQEQPKCAPYPEVEAMLAQEFQETRVQQGIVGDGEAMLAIFASPNGDTWTAVMVRTDGVACLAAAGTVWQHREDKPAPVEEGL